MPAISSVAVFCGSRDGHDPELRVAATELGTGLAHAGLRLIYGGAQIGMMGAIADAALAAGGEVVGVIPDFLTRREVVHTGTTEMIVTDGMHSRKQRMFAMADAFVTFAGGLGTLDETFEILTWKQLGLHDKPILLSDVHGCAQPLIALIDAVIADGFADLSARRLYEVVVGVPALLDRLTWVSATTGEPADPDRL